MEISYENHNNYYRHLHHCPLTWQQPSSHALSCHLQQIEKKLAELCMSLSAMFN